MKKHGSAMKKHRWLAAATIVLTGVSLVLAAAPAAEARTIVLRARRGPVIVVNAAKPAKRVLVVRDARTARTGIVDVNVTPKATRVFVDGTYRGTAGSLDGSPAKLRLSAGSHVIKLVTPGGLIVKQAIHVKAGKELNIGLAL